MKLPNGEHAVIDAIKLKEYCLNPAHPRGRHKARVFASALGIGRQDSEHLRTFLAKAAREAEAVLADKDEFGQRFVIDFQMAGPRGEAVVRSSWIILEGESVPRLVSCHVL